MRNLFMWRDCMIGWQYKFTILYQIIRNFEIRMKRLLIVSILLAADRRVRVQRWVKFSKYLPQYGWQPVIYTPETLSGWHTTKSLLVDVPSAEVIRTHKRTLRIYRRLTGKKVPARK